MNAVILSYSGPPLPRILLLVLIGLAFYSTSEGGQRFHTYVGWIESDSALLAWGTVGGSGNTIGRNSTPIRDVQVLVDGRTLNPKRNWIVVNGLEADRAYSYEIRVAGVRVGQGQFRTYPENSEKLAFFVFGDFGNGGRAQYRVAESMWAEFEKRRNSENPVRFVLTTGDNIYGWYRTGRRDSDWGSKFFQPYEQLLREVPFYPTLGNHDGNETEHREDLSVYLDNFFFPGGRPVRWYSFRFGGLAEFFALDTTLNTLEGPPASMYARGGPQHTWLQQALSSPRTPWRISYFHHPPFTAGPAHPPSLTELRHFIDLFERSGVNVVFNGHEHNFQIGGGSPATGGITYIVTGAGGELRSKNPTNLETAGIVGWAGVHHFLLVEIEGPRMRIQPIAPKGITVMDESRRPLQTPIMVSLPAGSLSVPTRHDVRNKPEQLR